MAMDFYNRYNVDLNNLIHHSDRGVQYCSNLYVGMLKKHHINISMTQCVGIRYIMLWLNG